jgi:hypothetical protein
MLRKRYILGTSIAMLVGVSATGIALASSAGGDHRSGAQGAAASTTTGMPTDILDAIGAFRSPSSVPDNDPALLQLEAMVSQGPQLLPGPPDWSSVRSAPIAGATGLAWIVPAGDSVCLFMPATDGVTADCSTVAKIEAGKAILIAPQAGPAGTVAVAKIVADGQTGPTVTDQEGSVTALTSTGNVAAAALPSSDDLDVAGISGALSQFVHPPGGQPAP